jgi:hypothetical protein
MSKVAVMVEDADVVEAFLRLLPQAPRWIPNPQNSQQSRVESISTTLKVTLVYDKINKKSEVQIMDAGNLTPVLALPASNQLYLDFKP